MLAICAAVCILVLGIYALADHGETALQRFQEAMEKPGLTYTEAMWISGAPEDYPPGMLTGLWGQDPTAEAWWWRCSLCREFDHSLTAAAAALEASTHECNPKALEAAKLEAMRQHPAFKDTELGKRYLP